MAETKICKKCGRELPLEAFSKHKGTKDGLQTWCRACQVRQVKEGRARKKAQEKIDAFVAGAVPSMAPTTIQDVKVPETGGKAARLAEYTDDELLVELKRRGFFCRDLYKYVKIDFESI